MTDTVAMALIAAVVTIATTAASTLLIWLKAAEATKAGQAAHDVAAQNLGQTVAVHELVNSQKAALVAEIAALKAEVQRLTPPPPPEPGA